MYLTYHEIKDKNSKEAVKQMIKKLYELNIPKKASKRNFNKAKEEIEKIAEKFNINCDVDFWINSITETPKNGFQVLNMYFDGTINHIVYSKKPYSNSRSKEWLIYR